MTLQFKGAWPAFSDPASERPVGRLVAARTLNSLPGCDPGCLRRASQPRYRAPEGGSRAGARFSWPRRASRERPLGSGGGGEEARRGCPGALPLRSFPPRPRPPCAAAHGRSRLPASPRSSCLRPRTACAALRCAVLRSHRSAPARGPPPPRAHGCSGGMRRDGRGPAALRL